MRRDNDWLDLPQQPSAAQDTRPLPPDAHYHDQNLNPVYSNSDFHNLYQNRQVIAKSAPQLMQPINGDVAPPDVDMQAPFSNGNEDEFEYHRVVLTRGEQGFGFRLVGGAEEGRNVAIGSIVIGGVASLGNT